jgi:hypothetical protein
MRREPIVRNLPSNLDHPILTGLRNLAAAPFTIPTLPHLMSIVTASLAACPTTINPLLNLTDQKLFILILLTGPPIRLLA